MWVECYDEISVFHTLHFLFNWDENTCHTRKNGTNSAASHFVQTNDDGSNCYAF